MKIERTRNTIRNMSWGYVYRLINMILPFCFRTVVIKTLGADYLGINSLFISILQVLSLSELGFSSAIVYSMYKPIAENDKEKLCSLLNYYKKIYCIIGSIMLGIGLILMPFIPYLISGGYPSSINLYFVYLMFLLNTVVSYFLFAYQGSLLNAFQRNDIESKILIAVSLVRYGIEIVGILITKDYYLFLYVELLSTILLNILKLKVTNKMYPDIVAKGSIEKREKVTIKRNVTALMYHKIGGIVLNSTANIVLSVFMGLVVVSNYGNYYYIMNAVESTIMICFAGMTAGIGNSFVTESTEKNRDYFKKVLFFNGWIVGFGSVCFACLYQDFIELWVGQQYMFNYGIVLLIVLYFFIHCIRRTIIVFRDGAGMWQDNKWQPIFSAILNLVISIILVKVMGVAGVLMASIVAMILIDIPWETEAFCKRIQMNSSEYIRLLFLYFFVTSLAVAITYGFTIMISFGPITNLFLKGILCIIFPNAIFWIVFRKKREMYYFKELIIRALQNKLNPSN